MKEYSIYEFPDIFRAVHMEHPGEIAEEVRFLKQVWARHLGRPLRRVLDVACGNSPHGQLLAAEGIAVAGIDRSAVMIAAGRRGARGLPNMNFYRRQIETFNFPQPRFHPAFFLSQTFPAIVRTCELTLPFPP